jgi:hypothetical protein
MTLVKRKRLRQTLTWWKKNTQRKFIGERLSERPPRQPRMEWGLFYRESWRGWELGGTGLGS